MEGGSTAGSLTGRWSGSVVDGCLCWRWLPVHGCRGFWAACRAHARTAMLDGHAQHTTCQPRAKATMSSSPTMPLMHGLMFGLVPDVTAVGHCARAAMGAH